MKITIEMHDFDAHDPATIPLLESIVNGLRAVRANEKAAHETLAYVSAPSDGDKPAAEPVTQAEPAPKPEKPTRARKPKTEATAPAEPTPAPEAEQPEKPHEEKQPVVVGSVTKDAAFESLREYIEVNGGAAAKKLLGDFGVERFSELGEAHYAELVTRIRENGGAK